MSDIVYVPYLRVGPRDFFNESKLLKCYGMLSLEILDGCLRGVELVCNGSPKAGFKIGQDQSSGDISVTNWVLRETHKYRRIHLYSQLNSRYNYPLKFGDGEFVFSETGEVTAEFRTYLKELMGA